MKSHRTNNYLPWLNQLHLNYNKPARPVIKIYFDSAHSFMVRFPSAEMRESAEKILGAKHIKIYEHTVPVPNLIDEFTFALPAIKGKTYITGYFGDKEQCELFFSIFDTPNVDKSLTQFMIKMSDNGAGLNEANPIEIDAISVGVALDKMTAYQFNSPGF